MKNLKLCLLASLFITINIFGQEKGIYLINKKNNDSTFITENLRIKVKTIYGIKLVGKFKIIDAKTINIDRSNIELERIVEIRRASMFHAILDPAAKVVTSVFALGILVSVSGLPYTANLSATLFLQGTLISIIPLIKSNHPVEKWEYHISNYNPKNEIK
jgi:hypothetical protein